MSGIFHKYFFHTWHFCWAKDFVLFFLLFVSSVNDWNGHTVEKFAHNSCLPFLYYQKLYEDLYLSCCHRFSTLETAFNKFWLLANNQQLSAALQLIIKCTNKKLMWPPKYAIWPFANDELTSFIVDWSETSYKIVYKKKKRFKMPMVWRKILCLFRVKSMS